MSQTSSGDLLRNIGIAIMLVAVISTSTILLTDDLKSPMLQIIAFAPAVPGLAYLLVWLQARSK